MAISARIETEVELDPWPVPNLVLATSSGEYINIRDLPADALRQLAAEWLTELYNKAGKPYDWRFD